MNDTPITDAHEKAWKNYWEGETVQPPKEMAVDLARRLEKDNARLREDLSELASTRPDPMASDAVPAASRAGAGTSC